MTLTQCNNLGTFMGAMRTYRVPVLKVVTAWGYHWDAASRAQAGSLPGLIVRTRAGDGTAQPGGPGVWLDPNIVQAELEPWIAARPRCMVELGNEPNAADPSDDSAWVWRYWFIETCNRIRAVYPGVRIISPGLIANRQANWWAINQDAILQYADLVGFHAYAWYNFVPGDTGQIEAALAQLKTYFPDRPWIATELGIHDPHTSAATKASRYYTLHLSLPTQVAAAVWYHYTDTPSDPDQKAYNLPTSVWGNLKSAGTIA